MAAAYTIGICNPGLSPRPTPPTLTAQRGVPLH